MGKRWIFTHSASLRITGASRSNSLWRQRMRSGGFSTNLVAGWGPCDGSELPESLAGLGLSAPEPAVSSMSGPA